MRGRAAWRRLAVLGRWGTMQAAWRTLSYAKAEEGFNAPELTCKVDLPHVTERFAWYCRLAKGAHRHIQSVKAHD